MGLEMENAIISSFLQTLGPWKDQIVIGGGFAPIIYKLYLANNTRSPPPIGTTDLDTLLSRRLSIVSKKNIAKHLEEAGFKRIHKTMDVLAVEAYIKKIENKEFEIEFLTDSLFRGDKSKNIAISGIVAQPLKYLELSLQEKVPFHTFSGQIGWVVSPSVWIFHKGLTFKRRKTKYKKQKDLYGIW